MKEEIPTWKPISWTYVFAQHGPAGHSERMIWSKDADLCTSRSCRWIAILAELCSDISYVLSMRTIQSVFSVALAASIPTSHRAVCISDMKHPRSYSRASFNIKVQKFSPHKVRVRRDFLNILRCTYFYPQEYPQCTVMH